MKKSVIIRVILAVILLTLFTYGASAAPPGLVKEEAVLSRAILIRMSEIEKKTSFRFNPDREIRVSLEQLGFGEMARYVAETQTLCFVLSLMYDFRLRYDAPLYELSPEIVAADNTWGPIIDHELGHLLMDQLSRKFGYGPWFFVDYFDSLSREQRLGINILGEGVGKFFEQINYSLEEINSELAFPADLEEQRNYTYKIIVNYGGNWLVFDILTRYGQRGLIWLVQHPFVAENNMRKAAVDYRAQALKELSEK